MTSVVEDLSWAGWLQRMNNVDAARKVRGILYRCMNRHACRLGQASSSDALKEALNSVERTSVWVAYERALESERGPDALFRDPLARQLVDAAGPELTAYVMSQTMEFGSAANAAAFGLYEGFHVTWMAIRTAFIDEWLAHSAKPGSPSDAEPLTPFTSPANAQFVNIGAGMDTRPYRLPCFAGRSVVEVDTAHAIASKRRVFSALGAAPLCAELTAVAHDLGDPTGALPAPLPGHDVKRPTDWLAEGLLPYLTLEDQLRLLRSIDGASAPGSRACLNYMEAVEWMPTLTPELLAEALPSWEISYHRFGDDTLNYCRVPQGVTSKKLSFALAVKRH